MCGVLIRRVGKWKAPNLISTSNLLPPSRTTFNSGSLKSATHLHGFALINKDLYQGLVTSKQSSFTNGFAQKAARIETVNKPKSEPGAMAGRDGKKQLVQNGGKSVASEVLCLGSRRYRFGFCNLMPSDPTLFTWTEVVFRICVDPCSSVAKINS